MSPDVLVLGGGPAGSAAARLLAVWGHSVRLVTRPAGEARVAESLPPSCSKLFSAIGVATAIDRAGFVRSTGNTVWWGSDEPRVELFADGGRGWQVEHSALEAVLLDQAAQASVLVERRLVTADDVDQQLRPWRQALGGSNQRPLKLRRSAEASAKAEDPPLQGAEDSPLQPASFILDCTGRAGVLARAMGLRRYDEGPRTIALVGSWRRDEDWLVPDPTHTIIESYEAGWAWSVPIDARLRHVAVMVDPQRSGLARGAPAREIYLMEIAKTREFRSLTAQASFDAGPWGWDASTYHAEQYAGDGWLLVGDAGSFIDPLSSAGAKKALASGWLAAVVAHTCLIRPEMRTHALAFFSARETEIHRRFTTITRRWLADASPRHGHRFWSDRADDPTHDNFADTMPDDESQVQAVFDRLRQASMFDVRRGAGVSVEPRPAVSGCEIVLEPRIVTADRPSGLRYVRDVDLITLIDLAPACSEVPDLFEAYCRRSGPVALPDFLHALSTALARGWLVAE